MVIDYFGLRTHPSYCSTECLYRIRKKWIRNEYSNTVQLSEKTLLDGYVSVQFEKPLKTYPGGPGQCSFHGPGSGHHRDGHQIVSFFAM